MKARSDFRQRDMVTTRYSLLNRLRNWEDEKSWQEFFDTYWRLIYSLAIQSGLKEVEAQDVVQETIICVARDIEKFQCDRALGSFKGWLRNLTRWRIADQLRKRGSSNRELEDHANEGTRPVLEEIPDSTGPAMETLWDEEWQTNLLEAALERVKRRVREEHFQIFDLYAVKQWPVTRVARRLGVSVAQVYQVKHRIAAQIKQEVEAMEKRLF